MLDAVCGAQNRPSGGLAPSRPDTPDAMAVSAPGRENRPQQRFALIDGSAQATGSSHKASHPPPGIRGPDGGAPRWSTSPRSDRG